MHNCDRIGPYHVDEVDPDEGLKLKEHIVRRLLGSMRVPREKLLTADEMRRKLKRHE